MYSDVLTSTCDIWYVCMIVTDASGYTLRNEAVMSMNEPKITPIEMHTCDRQ